MLYSKATYIKVNKITSQAYDWSHVCSGFHFASENTAGLYWTGRALGKRLRESKALLGGTTTRQRSSEKHLSRKSNIHTPVLNAHFMQLHQEVKRRIRHR